VTRAVIPLRDHFWFVGVWECNMVWLRIGFARLKEIVVEEPEQLLYDCSGRVAAQRQA